MNPKDPNFRVDFIGIGAAKSGTTWLANNLKQHPEICFSPTKEITYFNEYLVRMPSVKNPHHSKPLEWYHHFFEAKKDKQITGEISVQYLMMSGTAQKIYNYNPNVKILVILRDPPQQVFSWYLYSIQRGVINYATLEEAIAERPDLFANTFYYQQLQPYFNLFPKKNIKVLFFKSIKEDNKSFFKEVLDFLDVGEFYPESLTKKSNETKTLHFAWLTRGIQGIRHFITKHDLEFIIPLLQKLGIIRLGTFIRDKMNVKKMKNKPQLSLELEESLRAFYTKDITKLENLLAVDLTHWKSKK